MTIANLAPGTTVRITRVLPNGRVKFIKTGTVGDTITADYFDFTEGLNSSHPGKRVYVTTDRAVSAHMKGWTQNTAVL